jgi:RNA polymerase sigma-70 factor (ECF subfamily)
MITGEDSEFRPATADFDLWMRREQKRIFLLCLRLLRNVDEADSAAQDVFVKAFRTLERRGGRAILQPEKWLTRVAVHTCYDRFNSRRWKFWKRRASEDDEKSLLNLRPAAGMNQEEMLLQREKMLRLNQSLRRLSPRQRLVFILRHDEGKPLDEIASILEIDVGTVKAHLARAVAKLREELRDLYVR